MFEVRFIDRLCDLSRADNLSELQPSLLRNGDNDTYLSELWSGEREVMDAEVFGRWTGIQREDPVLWWWWEGEIAGRERRGLKRMRGQEGHRDGDSDQEPWWGAQCIS